jgi:hypothetical protein
MNKIVSPTLNNLYVLNGNRQYESYFTNLITSQADKWSAGKETDVLGKPLRVEGPYLRYALSESVEWEVPLFSDYSTEHLTNIPIKISDVLAAKMFDRDVDSIVQSLDTSEVRIRP